MKILIVTHGGYAKGCKSALELIVGDVSHIHAISLNEGEDPALFGNKLDNYFKEHEKDTNFLVFVDFEGGTPSNEIFKLIPKYNIHAIAGFNFPMLLDSAIRTLYGTSDDVDLDGIINEGITAAVNLNKKFKSIFG